MSNEKKLPKWAVTLMVIYFPAGLVYLVYKSFKKMKNDPNTIPQKIKTPIRIGWALIFICVMYLYGVKTGEYADRNPSDLLMMAVAAVILILLSVGLLVYSYQYKKLGKIYGKYIPHIHVGSENRIDVIAAAAGVDYNTALAELDRLIHEGLIPNAYISQLSGKLVFYKEQAKEVPKNTVICLHCNGENLVAEGQDAVCDYCDMPLNS